MSQRHAAVCTVRVLTPPPFFLHDTQDDVIRTNFVGLLMLADACHERGIHLTTFASGCIYQYDDSHPMGSDVGFKEDDTPNFEGSFYSYMRVKAEMMLKEYPNVLTLRLRMPIVSDLACQRNFITKILMYPKVGCFVRGFEGS